MPFNRDQIRAAAQRKGREVRPPSTLTRQAPFAQRAVQAEEGSDGLTLDGYAAVFKRETLIDSWEGRFWEQLSPGSMRKSFSETTPRLQFDHGQHPTIGSIPIGKITRVAEERDAERAPDGGAHVVGRLFDNWLIEPVRDAIAAEAVDGMSFRFSVVKEVWTDRDGKVITDEDKLWETLYRSWAEEWADEDLPHRNLREVKVPELGPVVWPAYDETSVGMRSGSGTVVIDLSRLRSGKDPAERRKLAELMFLADEGEARSKNPHPQGEDEGTMAGSTTEVPEPTADAAGSHTETEAHDEPETTADAAGTHTSRQVGTPTHKTAVSQWRERVRKSVQDGTAYENRTS